MELAKIFQAIEETQFLKLLSSQSRLFFVGNAAPLTYIKKFLSQFPDSNDNYYYELPTQTVAKLPHFTEINRYQAIVVVSLADETALQSQISQQFANIVHPPILRLFSDIFVNRLCGRQLLQPSSPMPDKAQKSYAILTTPRSGSTYFCDLLDSTAIAGHPAEHIRLATQELSLHCNFDYLNLLGNLMAHRTTSNGVFGTKLISHFLFELKRAKPSFRAIFKEIDYFILLIRQDKVAQAVSLFLAQTTEIWHIHNNANKASYQSILDEIEINDALLDEVEQKVIFFEQQEARLKRILANHNIEPLIVVYEDILQDASAEVNRVLDFLGIVKPAGHTLQIASGIKRMPSAISQQIIQQYQHRKAMVH